MKRTGLFIIILLSGVIMAQTPAMVNWTCMTPDCQDVSAEGGNLAGLTQTSSPGFEVRDYTSGPGPDQRWWPYEGGAAVSWGEETAQVDSRWVQFAAYPKTGFEFKCSEISIYLGAKGTGSLRANVAIDTSADFSNASQLNSSAIELVKDSDSLYVFSVSMDVPAGDTLFFRIYPWYTGAASTSKYLYVRNMTISGITQAIPVAAYALWPFEEDNQAATSGPLVAYAETYSAAMKFYEITTLPTTGGNNVTCGSIQTVSKSWNAEQDLTDSLWFEYAVEPKFGGTFTVKEVSLYIGGWFTSDMRAAIYYSKDSSFAEKTLLIADTLLSGNQVMPLKADLVDTVKTGETFYLRIYPHNTTAVGWAKLVAVDSVKISGMTVGATAVPPSITTSAVSRISTNTVVCGGTVTNDGGSTVTERGVCWNTTGGPSILDSRTSDDEGAGNFTSSVSGLSNGTTYYICAYATNAAGTAYGEEQSFTTLQSIIPPTVSTNSVSSIMIKTAICGGNVSDWGGDDVTVRGICWNMTGSPTISDNFTANGDGTGSFTSGLYNLTADTKYYVRAYATNSAGTGYGNELSFTTQIPADPVFKIVAKDGTGNYETIQAAFDDIPNYYTGQYTIFVKKGMYYEKLMLDRYKTNVILKGEDRDSTILTYDDYAGIAGGTSMCYSVAIDADDFIAENITFQNTVKNDGSVSDQQGVALRVNGDRQAYYNCNLLGYQDTYYTWGGRGTARIYMKNCYIEGSVDFIFGRDIVVFDSCEIHINREGGTLTAASTEATSQFGYVFRNCILSADSIGFDGRRITNFYLGRPWQGAPRTVFIQCEEPEELNTAGWLSWNVTPGLYAEYLCTGAGSGTGSRHSFSTQLADTEVAGYTLENIFSTESSPDLAYDWMPEYILVGIGQEPEQVQLPSTFQLYQNYPNPFNPTTTISYDLPTTSQVRIQLFDMLGRQVMTIVNQHQNAGHYLISFDGGHLASGIYFCLMDAGEFHKTMKMMLLK